MGVDGSKSAYGIRGARMTHHSIDFESRTLGVQLMSSKKRLRRHVNLYIEHHDSDSGSDSGSDNDA